MKKSIKEILNDTFIESFTKIFWITIIVIIILLSSSLYTNIKIIFISILVIIVYFYLDSKRYRNLKKIEKYLIENNLEEELLNIRYWNWNNAILTNKHLIITNKKIYILTPKDIKSLEEETYIKSGSKRSISYINHYVNIETKDNENIKILIYKEIYTSGKHKYNYISDNIIKLLKEENKKIIIKEKIEHNIFEINPNLDIEKNKKLRILILSLISILILIFIIIICIKKYIVFSPFIYYYNF